MFPDNKLVFQYLGRFWKNCSVGMGMFSIERRIKLSSAGAAHSARVPVGRSWHSKGVGLAQPVLHAQLKDLWYSRLHPHLPPHKLLLYGGFSTGGLLCWDLTNSKQVQSMEVHFSVVTAFSIAYCGFKAVSCGIDAVCVV